MSEVRGCVACTSVTSVPSTDRPALSSCARLPTSVPFGSVEGTTTTVHEPLAGGGAGTRQLTMRDDESQVVVSQAQPPVSHDAETSTASGGTGSVGAVIVKGEMQLAREVVGHGGTRARAAILHGSSVSVAA